MMNFFSASVKNTIQPSIPRSVINSGVGGNSTDNIIGRMSSILANDFNLSILMVGTNDFLNSAKLNDEAQYQTNMQSIITSLKTKGDVILLNILPCISSYVEARHTYSVDYIPVGGDLNDVIDSANLVVDGLVTSESTGFYNVNQQFKDHGEPREDVDSWLRNLANTSDTPTGTTDDGVHPTATGYDAFALPLANYIKANYTNDKIICVGDSITFGVHVDGDGTADPTAETYPSRMNYYLNL